MVEAKLPDLHIFVLSRMYDYTGHLLREVSRDPSHLCGHIIRFRDASWKRTMTALVGHQGHHGRVSPWTWERQYDTYFNDLGVAWQSAAIQKSEWNRHKGPWIKHTLGSSLGTAVLGKY